MAEQQPLARRAAAATALVVIALISGCGQPRPAVAAQPSPDVSTTAAGGRFSVDISAGAIQAARAVRVDLNAVVAQDLHAIDAKLPGPRTSITIKMGTALPETGSSGVTDPANGEVRVSLSTGSAQPFSKTVGLYLNRDLAHEIDHSVRILAGPGYGASLLDSMVSEGLADDFATAAVPGPTNPWDSAIGPGEEAVLWGIVQPETTYDRRVIGEWLFGGPTIPRWTGYTIGYHIVEGYRAKHPAVTAEALTKILSGDILAGSGYKG